MANQNHGGGQPHPSASFQFQQQPQNVHGSGGGYDPHRFPRQLPTLDQYLPRFYHPDDQRRQPSQQPTYIHYDPTQESQVYPTVFNPAMAQPLLYNQPPPPPPGIEQQGPLVHDPQQPIYGYYDLQGNFYPTGTFFFATMAQNPQQQRLTVYPQLLPPQDPTSGIEQHEPLVQDRQPSILSPTTTTTTIVVPAPSMYDSIIVSPRDFFDSQDVKDAIKILRMNLDIIYELRRKYHGNVSIDSTYPINALSEKSSELTLAHVTVNILEAVLDREAECPGATFSRIPLKKLLEDYGIPESHRSFVEKFLMERDMKYWSYLVFMSIYFDLSPLPPKL